VKEEYRTGLWRGGVAAVFAFALFVLKAGAAQDLDIATLYDAGYAGLIAAAPFFGYGVYDGAKKGGGP